jgi:hypothetical protein
LDVPVQYFQSVITIELAVSGALLWQIRYFESSTARREGEPLPDARLRVGLAVVMGATSLVPILARVLPPLAKDATTNERDPDYAVTIIGLLLYVVVVAGVLLLLDIE